MFHRAGDKTRQSTTLFISVIWDFAIYM